MGDSALVLVHGCKYDSRCWQPTIDALSCQAPGVSVLAVNLPARQGVPGELGSLTVEDCVTAVVGQIEQSGFDHVVLVGHSLAGIIVPKVAAILGAERVRRIICIACSVPPDGQRILDTLIPPIRVVASLARDRLPSRMARWMFCNGMTPIQRAYSMGVVVPDNPRLTREPAAISDLPPQIPRSWVMTLRDHCVPPKRQQRFIDHLGGIEEIIPLDTCHNAMISMPDELAAILAARV